MQKPDVNKNTLNLCSQRDAMRSNERTNKHNSTTKDNSNEKCIDIFSSSFRDDCVYVYVLTLKHVWKGKANIVDYMGTYLFDKEEEARRKYW